MSIISTAASAAFLVVLVASNGASAQTTPQEGVSAGWAIDATISPTYLATKDIATPRWFLISMLGPDKGSSTELIVDGKTTNYPVNYGGTVLTYGKSIAAKMYLGDQPQYGSWRIVVPENLADQNFSWTIFPETNKETSAGIFDKKREVLVSFGKDLYVGDCQNGKLKVIVDDHTVVDANGRDLVLIQGGSTIVVGQSIRLSLSGTCKPNKSFNGAIRLM